MIAALIIAAVLGAMAVAQLVSFRGFLRALDGYGLGNLVEGVAALLLTIGWLRDARGLAIAGAESAVAAAAVWSVLAVQAYVRKLPIRNCGCFGIYLPQRLSAWILAQDALFLMSTSYVLIKSLAR
ncbi:MAG TPA: hypothetical protein VNM92_01450 [Thermoanaerobaculia bacterium]|nr:hypothetical protein [Thermoanaerobaculia bacterium]